MNIPQSVTHGHSYLPDRRARPWPVFISRSAEGRRLSWSNWLVTYQDYIPAEGHPTQYKPGSTSSNFVDVTWAKSPRLFMQP